MRSTKNYGTFKKGTVPLIIKYRPGSGSTRLSVRTGGGTSIVTAIIKQLFVDTQSKSLMAYVTSIEGEHGWIKWNGKNKWFECVEVRQPSNHLMECNLEQYLFRCAIWSQYMPDTLLRRYRMEKQSGYQYTI